MESISNLIPKPSKKTEDRICQTCGANFTANIYILKDHELDIDRLCPECNKRKKDQEALAIANEALIKVSKERREHWKMIYGIGGFYHDKTFDNFDSKLQPDAYQAVKSYNDKSMVLLSPNIYGVGKTHLVAALANYLIATRPPAVLDPSLRVHTLPCPAYFTVETSLLARIRDTFNSEQFPGKETEEKVYRFINSFPLFILDDVGKVRPRDISFLQSVYFRILDQRYTERKQIILTTNLDYAGLANHIGGACIDRLAGMAGKDNFIVLKGQSCRQS
jgi:DNA replication protein DnaC